MEAGRNRRGMSIAQRKYTLDLLKKSGIPGFVNQPEHQLNQAISMGLNRTIHPLVHSAIGDWLVC